MSTAGFHQADRADFPAAQSAALRKAVRWQVFTICYTIATIFVVAQVMGSSQAMKTTWVEDLLSLVPQVAFPVSLGFIHRAPTKKHPYGYHRAMGGGHLAAGISLLRGQTIWFGWLMVGVMLLIVVGPAFLYGPAKKKLAPVLHNKLLSADADMATADWHTNAATLDLMDQRSLDYRDNKPHPLADEVVGYVASLDWVAEAAVRVRDEGQVFHIEVFIEPVADWVTPHQLGAAADAVAKIDWKVQDVVVIPTKPVAQVAHSRADRNGRGT